MKNFKNRETQKLSNAINKFIEARGWEEKLLQSKLQDDWEAITSKNVANAVRIKELRGRILYLKTSNSVWKNEMYLRKDKIVEKINEKYGENTVISIVLL